MAPPPSPPSAPSPPPAALHALRALHPLPRDPRTGARWALGAAALALVAAGAYLAGRASPGSPFPPAHGSVTEVRPSPSVIMAVRELARLETADYHMERVIELTDTQTHLFGLLDAKDALLLVAVADVAAGVDFQKLDEGDVRVDGKASRVHLRLPAPEVFAVTLDNARTRVVSRSTDALATRKESLEGEARKEAEASMRAAAAEAGILDHARSGAERSLRDLLRALGFEAVEIEWRVD